MARDIEDTLTTRLTLLFNERYGLPEAVTQSLAGGNFLDVFVPIENIKVVVEAKKGQTTLRKRQAARDADKRLRAGHADVAFALCYPEEATLATLPTDTLIWQVRQDPDATVQWREGTAEDLAREIRLAPLQVDQTNLAARILSNALDDAVLMLNAQERENLARALDLPPKRTKRKGKDGKEREQRTYETAAKRGLLVIAAAMLFQFRLQTQPRPEGHDGRWPPTSVQECAESGFAYTAFDDAWALILRVDYKPIFETARKALANLPPSFRLFRDLGRAAVECSSKTAGSRHDLVGRIFHRVLESARYDGSYYTSTAAATLLAELAIEEESAADPLSLRVCDPACGTGTLLMTAAARLRDLRSDGVDEDEFDRRLVEDVLWGYDINLTAAHLAATTLGMDSPSVKFVNMNIHRALLGWHKLDEEKRPYRVTRKSDNPETYIGSVGFIDGQQPLALWPTLAQHIEEQDTRPHHPPQADLVIMNPPFTRNDIRHDQFGEAEEKAIKSKEREILSKTGALAAAGLHSSGGAFGMLGDWLVKRESGTLAMVLPTVALSGAANQPYRQFLARKFHIDLIVSIHDPERVFFSENTGIGECLLIARRWDDLERGAKPPTRMINLARNPATRIDALRLAERIRRGDALEVAKKVNGLYASPEGRPAYPPLTMVKIIILQQWHDASDVAIEEAVSDRLSFRRFAGLSLTDAVPDHSTISRFRKEVAERGLARRLFAEVGRQLEKKGLLVKKGTLIDASVIKAQARRPGSEAGAEARRTLTPRGRARGRIRVSSTNCISGWTEARGSFAEWS